MELSHITNHIQANDSVFDPMIIEQNTNHTKPETTPNCSKQKNINFFNISSSQGSPLSFKNALTKDLQQNFSDQHPSDSAIPLPTRKGEFMTFSINKQLHEGRIKYFESALIGRLVLSPGDKPKSLESLKLQLQEIWKPKDNWLLSSMGRGYYTFRFASIEEKNRIWATPIPSLRPGSLRLQPWAPFFNPYKLKTTNAQVWVRFYELGTEYYYSSFLWNLARCLGTPLKIDNRSLDGTLTHFARILIEIDLSKPLENQIMIDHGEGLCVFTSIGYEKIPDFCKHCNTVGHSIANCRRIKNEKEKEISRDRSKFTTQNIQFSEEEATGKNDDEKGTKGDHLASKKGTLLNKDPTWPKDDHIFSQSKQKWGDMDDEYEQEEKEAGCRTSFQNEENSQDKKDKQTKIDK